MADEVKQDRSTLSYDPANLPEPVSASDFYLRAMLVELRLIRRALQAQAQPPQVSKEEAPVSTRKK